MNKIAKIGLDSRSFRSLKLSHTVFHDPETVKRSDFRWCRSLLRPMLILISFPNGD